MIAQFCVIVTVIETFWFSALPRLHVINLNEILNSTSKG